MLTYLDQAYRAGRQRGVSFSKADLHQTIVEGASLRVRPVLMTVGSTIFGLLPIMWGHGTGSEVMQRIAAPMVGGLVTSMILALLCIPAIYSLWREWELEK